MMKALKGTWSTSLIKASGCDYHNIVVVTRHCSRWY